jgi:hypothetical protein
MKVIGGPFVYLPVGTCDQKTESGESYINIRHQYKSRLIILEPETVDAEGYVDKFIDQSGIIPDMNERYGSKQWTYGHICGIGPPSAQQQRR